MTTRGGAEAIAAVETWIASNVRGKTFADVGGIGVNAQNERITLASKAGAREATMIDIRPGDYYEWDLFRERCRQEQVEGYKWIDSMDINDPKLLERVGRFDIVHCTGIVYHLPNPVAGVVNLCRIVKDLLIINTVIAPPVISNEHGRLEFPGNTTLFMPGLSETERLILHTYYQAKFNDPIFMGIDYISPPLNAEDPSCPWFDNGEPTCWPYWWLFTENSFTALVEMIGFKVIDAALWRNHALTLLAKRV